ncbi:5dd72dd2-5e97-4f65-977b-23592e0fb39b-CDS [Sclerotinia trifoliorum]|uniref:5dd72dd2-5e97-4f65-977b-23592e0fb39b-CDS n=1 Tax=Sclerotinia trifoliorum TaxID=28548 RepID=A0A8H2ZYF7_9HELO|nr:5dd72dd2-5e97-4f65-977b-23592e0fb39b-CDS [Sclerotinia trifoliorum]
MPFPKKLIPFASILTATFLFLLFKSLYLKTQLILTTDFEKTGRWHNDIKISSSKWRSQQETQKPISFHPGIVKPYPGKYSKMLVIASTSEEDVSWVMENFENDTSIQSTIYRADDPQAEYHPPKNKGHEVMIYLSYIIENYNNLSDVSIFMHSHQTTWHNNELLDLDSAQMISRLSSERVIREGYMNLRCHWHPGCPDWMHPGIVEEDDNKQEQTIMARAWLELFPLEPVPDVLAQPCCAQFAVSKERIQTLPLARYIFYRDWLLRTELSDYISGRVWEYIWQFVFSGQTILCPKEHICYCDGYGICFGGEMEYQAYLDKQTEKDNLKIEIEEWDIRNEEMQNLIDEGREEEIATLEGPDPAIKEKLEKDIDEIQRWLEINKEEAMQRGDVAPNRAKEAGREWKDGDGF